jgi:hypothetical protein
MEPLDDWGTKLAEAFEKDFGLTANVFQGAAFPAVPSLTSGNRARRLPEWSRSMIP